MAAMINTNVSSLHTPPAPKWTGTPFHAGEIEVQKRFGAQEYVSSYAPRFIRPYMPRQHRDFYMAQPFLAVAARDSRGMMWSSLLFSSDSSNVSGFISSPDDTTLLMETQPLPGDALEGELQVGSDLGIIGIEFSTRSRNRVNGRVVKNDGQSVVFQVDQSFGNCPQYIKSREWWTARSSDEADTSSTEHKCTEPSVLARRDRSTRLSPDQSNLIIEAETIFLATGYRGEGEDPRYGNDASHRGGPPGFLSVVDAGDKDKLLIPDFSGNNHFNTIGNLVKDARMGVTVPLFDTGGLLQLSGTTTVLWDEEESAAIYPGALRMLEFTIDEIVELPTASLPIQWNSDSDSIQLQVAEKVDESTDVTSFYLAPIEGGLPSFKPGQHIAINLQVGNDERITRNYSISSFDNSGTYYRISIKRDPFGVGSRYLHDRVEAGDVLSIQAPAGDFVLPDSSDSETLLLLSAGIGVTPILSMVHSLLHRSYPYKKVIWIHTARNGKLHPFKDETTQLAKYLGDKLASFVAYTRPTASDFAYDHEGRMTLHSLGHLLEAIETRSADAFLCGPPGFVGTMEDHLKSLGVRPERVKIESF